MGEEGFALNHSVEKLASENPLFLFSHSAVKISTLEPKLNVMAFFCSALWHRFLLISLTTCNGTQSHIICIKDFFNKRLVQERLGSHGWN